MHFSSILRLFFLFLSSFQTIALYLFHNLSLFQVFLVDAFDKAFLHNCVSIFNPSSILNVFLYTLNMKFCNRHRARWVKVKTGIGLDIHEAKRV